MTFNFCPECAKPLTKKTNTEYTCKNGHTFWNNPKATVAVVIVDGDKVLVAKRGGEPNKGMYDLPGGFMEYGEDVFDAVKREIREETSMKVDDLVIIGACTGIYLENESVCDLMVVARKWSGKPRASDDVAALEWKPFSFIDSPEFSPDYSGLVDILETTYNKPVV